MSTHIHAPSSKLQPLSCILAGSVYLSVHTIGALLQWVHVGELSCVAFLCVCMYTFGLCGFVLVCQRKQQNHQPE